MRRADQEFNARVDVGREQLFCWRRHHPRFGVFIGLANIGAWPVTVDLATTSVDVVQHGMVDLLAPGATELGGLAPHQVRWLASPEAYVTVPAPHR